MNFKELALTFDARMSPVEAVWAYEVAINDPDVEIEMYLNLAVLYFECVDFGYAAHHRLSEDLVSGAWDRAFQILAEAKERFGNQTELEFWQLYFSFIYAEGEPIDMACKELAQKGDSLVPYMYLFTSSGKKRWLEEVKKLLELVEDGTTERKRYIKSVIT